jgi:serine/threonine protein phosphatase PrpC
MKVIPGNAQHIGDRESQQDAFGFSSFGDHAFERHGGVMMVLCDGMGGLAHGADASRAAVDAILAGYQRKTPRETIPDALNRAIFEAHQAVCEVSGGGQAAGTTVVAAVVWQDRLFWGALGDSRLYLCRGDGPARQLTEDHNVATLMEARVRSGKTSRGEAAATRNLEALTAYLGAPVPPAPHASRDGIRLLPGDRIVACSDGLYRGTSPASIATTSRSAPPMVAAERMVQAVLRQQLPHQDNLTVALFEISAEFPLLVRRNLALLVKAAPLIGSFAAGVLLTSGVFLLASPRSLDPGSPRPPSAPGVPPGTGTAGPTEVSPAPTQSQPGGSVEAPRPDPAEPQSDAGLPASQGKSAASSPEAHPTPEQRPNQSTSAHPQAGPATRSQAAREPGRTQSQSPSDKPQPSPTLPVPPRPPAQPNGGAGSGGTQ